MSFPSTSIMNPPGRSAPEAYEEARKYIIEKYRDDVRIIYTTVGNWETR